jgi:hypothetical protein
VGLAFQVFLKRARNSQPTRVSCYPYSIKVRLLSLDPGNTTGWALFNGEGKLLGCGQMPATSGLKLDRLISLSKATHLVIEEYRIYPWKMAQHSMSDVPTLRLVGAIELIAAQRKLPLRKQGANLAKGFCTNLKLASWGLLQATQAKRHANDAVRHACYALLFATT